MVKKLIENLLRKHKDKLLQVLLTFALEAIEDIINDFREQKKLPNRKQS